MPKAAVTSVKYLSYPRDFPKWAIDTGARGDRPPNIQPDGSPLRITRVAIDLCADRAGDLCRFRNSLSLLRGLSR